MGEFFSFKKMMTPVLIQVGFVIGLVFCLLGGIAGISDADTGGEAAFIGFYAFIMVPIVLRVWCELAIVIFRVFSSVEGIRKVLEREDKHGGI